MYNYIRNENIEFIYLRYDHNANPFLILFLKSLQKLRVKVFMEIPTYPYDKEYKGLSLDYQRILFLDKCFRERIDELYIIILKIRIKWLDKYLLLP